MPPIDDKTGQVNDDYVIENDAHAADEPVDAGTEIPTDVLEKLLEPEKAQNPQEWQHLRRKYDAPLREIETRTQLEEQSNEPNKSPADDGKKPPAGERDPETGRFAKEETGDPAKKPGGDGKPEKPGADDPAKDKDPLHDFMGKRLARERRKSAKEITDLRTENTRLKAESEGRKPNEPPAGAELEEPNIDDPKYETDDEGSLYLADLDAWEAQETARSGGETLPKDQGGERQRRGAPPERKPNASPAAEAVADLVRSLDGADEEGKLATDFDDGLAKGSIVVSDELVVAFDAPGFPEGEFVRVARMFVEKPWLSKRIARQESGTHFQAMMTLLGQYENPPQDEGTPRQTREPLRGGRGEPAKGKDAVDYAMEGNFDAFVKTRKAEDKAKEEPWIN